MKHYLDVTAAIIRKGKRVLIAQRAETMSHPGKWEFPGGKKRFWETKKKCLKREIKEEFGVEIAVGNSALTFEHDYSRPDKKIHRFFSYFCSIVEGEPVLKEHQALAWVFLDDLADYDFIEADKQLVLAICLNR